MAQRQRDKQAYIKERQCDTAVPVEIVVAASGLISSFLSGLLGIGGGIVLTPLLLFGPQLLGAPAIPVKIVTGLTVVQAISGSVLGAQRHRAYGNVSTRLVLLMGPPAAIASLAGALLSGGASEQLLLAIFAAFSFAGAIFLVLPVESQNVAAHEVRANAPVAIALAVFIGGFGGMVGIGAIAFIVAVLVYFLRVPPRVAIGSSLAIGLFGAVAALIGKAATAQVDAGLAAIIVGAALVGSPLGAWVSVRTKPDVLMRVLAALVAVAAVRIAWSAATGV
ncbi:MAG TPA: sulfite exporter TauE/SafE family protein [Candidatus Limnocylindria bacterium]|nr:sulfite exporter TauE/SafE family protein [Candidatus Limnocylindria bacterium]